jgi:protein-disulfide isomerase
MAAEGERRQRLLQLAAGAVFLAIVAVAVLIVIGNSGGSAGGGSPPRIEGAREVMRMLRGIDQYGFILGDEAAPVELVEFGDPQCPVCKMYAEDILPPIIEGPVKAGRVKVSFRNVELIGPDSAEAGSAALAAGEESLGWNYLELLYRNQGEENSGYVDEDFLRAIAKAVGVEDMAKWAQHRKTVAFETDFWTEEAQRLGINGTPSFAIRGPGTKGQELLGTPGSTEDLEAAIERAAG